jgi:hypothetical protein
VTHDAGGAQAAACVAAGKSDSQSDCARTIESQQSGASLAAMLHRIYRARLPGAPPQAHDLIQWRNAMQTRAESNARRATRWALMSAVAALALLARLPAAQAADQQASDEAKTYALSQEVTGTGAYAQAQAPAPAPRHHRGDAR